MSDSSVLIILVPALVAAFLGWLVVCFRQPRWAALAIVLLVIFSSHVLALAYVLGAPAAVVRNAIAIKDVLAWSLLAILLTRAAFRRTSPVVLAAIGLAVAMAATFFVFQQDVATFNTQVQAVRSVLVGILALGIGQLLDGHERTWVAVNTIRATVVGVVLAAIQLLLPASFVRDRLGVGPYWAEVKGVSAFLDPYTGLPGNFFTSAGYPRLSGTFGDPLSAGMVIAVAIALALAYRDHLNRPRLDLSVLSVGLLLTFTRNGWIVAVFAGGAFIARRYGLGRLLGAAAIAFAALGLSAALLPPVAAYLSGVLSGQDSSTIVHQQSLADSLSKSIPLIGSGWGMGGAAASITNSDAVSSESAFLAVLSQIGVVGFLILAVATLLIVGVAYRRSAERELLVAVGLAMVVSAFVSENVLTFNAGWIPFLTLSLLPSSDAARAFPSGISNRVSESHESEDLRAIPEGRKLRRPRSPSPVG